jgi:hypothetical protein
MSEAVEMGDRFLTDRAEDPNQLIRAAAAAERLRSGIAEADENSARYYSFTNEDDIDTVVAYVLSLRD